jgi:hypothetical protein
MGEAPNLGAFALESHRAIAGREFLEVIVVLSSHGVMKVTAEGIIIRRVIGGNRYEL